jgi:hypothetical protein
MDLISLTTLCTQPRCPGSDTPCPLYNYYLLVVPRIFGVFNVNHYYLTFELVLV